MRVWWVRGGVVAMLAGAALWMRMLPEPGIATLYFSDGRFLVPVSRQLPSGIDPPRAALQALLDGPLPGTGLTSLVPAGLEVRSFAMTDGTARIDLASSRHADHDMTAAASAVALTMSALPSVAAVVLSIDGRTIADHPMRPPLLYFAGGSGLTAVPVRSATAREALEVYMAGAPDPALTGVPPDARLLDYSHDGDTGTVTLNFKYTDTIRALAIERPMVMRTVLLGLIATLTEFPGVRAVSINFEGRTRLGLGQCSDLLGTPQPRPRLLNDERLLG